MEHGAIDVSALDRVGSGATDVGASGRVRRLGHDRVCTYVLYMCSAWVCVGDKCARVVC